MQLPPFDKLNDLVELDDDSVTFCAPLSMSLNQMRRMHWAARRRFEQHAASHVHHEVLIALRGVERPWADRARLEVVRCSMGPSSMDADALTAGLKPFIDAAVRAGLLPDDDQNHLEHPIVVDDRRRGQWGDRPGPGTWMTWRRVA